MTRRSLVVLILFGAWCGAATAADHAVRYEDASGRTHEGVLTLPAGPARALPLVVVPEGGAFAGGWGGLPDRGSFALLRLRGGPARVGPDGIDALGEAPAALRRAFPGLSLAPGRIYVFGRGEGARRGLRLAVRRPHLLAGVAALDPFTGTGFLPSGRQLAYSQVPLQLWSGPAQRARSEGLASAIRAARAGGRVLGARGAWPAKLETALLGFGLLPFRAEASRPAARRLASRSACAPPGVLSYPWPVKPFGSPHPVRGNVGDPRTQFGLASPDEEDAVGSFAFHNGADVVAPGGTPVYPVASGVAEPSGRYGVVVRSPGGRSFDYEHIEPLIAAGQSVVAGKTVLGHVLARSGHVHLAEFAPDGSTTNPLLHLTPYADPTAPVVASAVVPGSALGRVDVSAVAYDVPARAAGGSWTGLPVAPARITLALQTRAGRELRRAAGIDFTRGVPRNDTFRSVYAPGTRQNFAVVGFHYFAGAPGSYRYRLSLDIRTVAPGRYTLVVLATDTCGNTGALARPIRILRDPSWRPPPPPPVPPPAPPTVPPTPAAPRPPLRWPGRGYTVVLASVPERAGKNAARSVAVRARAAGLARVGVLRSARYHALAPGYRVVFSGVYRSSAAALAASERIGRRFPGAYPRHVGAAGGARQERRRPPRTLRG